MQLHELKRNTANKKSRKVGRGGVRGKTAGRGTKGQKARAGHRIRPEIRDTIKRLPKLRGRGVNSNKSFAPRLSPVNLSLLEEKFSGSEVTLATLKEQKLIAGGSVGAKILGKGDIAKKLTISGLSVSESAKAKIEKAGGKVN
ncbi:MAG: 50S ribosomal protein L15 [Candidatus Paceibacterota bacterium]